MHFPIQELSAQGSNSSCWHYGKLQETAGAVHQSVSYPNMCRVTVLSGKGVTIATAGERLIMKKF